MKIFCLEDDPDRIRLFCKWFDPFNIEWDCIQTCQRAHQFKPPYDMIFLDHDLGGRQLEDHEDCGTTFAYEILSRVVKDNPIIIHSHNHEAAKNMEAIFYPHVDQVKCLPFGWESFLKNIKQIQQRTIEHQRSL